MIGPHVAIKLDGIGGTVTVGDHDISDAIAGLTLHAGHGQLPSLEVDLVLLTGEVAAGEVDIPESTEAALLALGWMPPPAAQAMAAELAERNRLYGQASETIGRHRDAMARLRERIRALSPAAGPRPARAAGNPFSRYQCPRADLAEAEPEQVDVGSVAAGRLITGITSHMTVLGRDAEVFPPGTVLLAYPGEDSTEVVVKVGTGVWSGRALALGLPLVQDARFLVLYIPGRDGFRRQVAPPGPVNL